MNGIAIVIPNTDFSASPLGQVTFSVSNLEKATNIATAYCTAIGSSTHKDALIAFVKSLLDSNIWDDVKAFFPMVGNTLSSQLVDLKDTERSAWAGANFSYDEKGVHIANDIDAGVPSSDLWYVDTPFIGRSCIFAGYSDNTGGMNTHPIFSQKYQDANDGSDVVIRDGNSLSFALGYVSVDSLAQAYYGNSSDRAKSGISESTPARYVSFSFNQTAYLYTNGTQTSASVSASFNNRNNVKEYPIVGVRAGDSTKAGDSVDINDSDPNTSANKVGQRSLDGKCFAFGFANFDAVSKVEAFDAAFGAFLAATGKITE